MKMAATRIKRICVRIKKAPLTSFISYPIILAGGGYYVWESPSTLSPAIVLGACLFLSVTVTIIVSMFLGKMEPNRYDNKENLLNRLNIYIEGKMKRYSILFAVNGGAFAIIQLLTDNSKSLPGMLTYETLAWGAIIFSLIMTYDIWTWGWGMRFKHIGKDAFTSAGRAILLSLGGLIMLGWFLIAIGSSGQKEIAENLKRFISASSAIDSNIQSNKMVLKQYTTVDFSFISDGKRGGLDDLLAKMRTQDMNQHVVGNISCNPIVYDNVVVGDKADVIYKKICYTVKNPNERILNWIEYAIFRKEEIWKIATIYAVEVE